MKLTEKKAIELTLELWRWLAETGKNKCDWPGWEINGGIHSKVQDYCFFCEYAVTHRKNGECWACPYQKKFGDCQGQDEDTPYDLWEQARTPKANKKYAQQLVGQLETLLKEDKND
ncbi:hypothetical protein LCGC14_0488560 [marine sediment metagenome]|uniref:Uncharacterized protein n=1 Tax=marine sediment metagenome TaxID=412755 RepID=A0A0F9SCH2_9ZZZZ